MQEIRVQDHRRSGFARFRDRGHWVSPGRVIAALLGLGVTFVGAVAVYRAGFDSDLTTPMTTVFSIPQSAAVGLVELAAGLLLLISASSEAARGVAGAVGFFAVIAGVAAVASSAQLQADYGFGVNTGWFFVVWGATALVSALLPAVWKVDRDVEVLS